MANLRTIQFLRNATVYDSLQDAKDDLIEKANGQPDGSPIVGRYKAQTGDTADKYEVRSILGIVNNGTISLFNNIDEIDNVLQNLDYEAIGGTEASVVTEIQQTDGKISGQTANVGTLKLTGYEEGSASGHVEAADSINSGIAKLQNQIDAANEKVNALDASSVSGESTVIIDVTQNDGQITATAANLTGVKLDGLSTTADTKIESTDTLGAALAKLQGQINSMDKEASAVAGQVVTTVAEADGKVTETKASVKDLQLGGYAKSDATGAISGTDTINTALSKLENTVGANKITNADNSIVVTEPTGTATTTDIKVNIKSNEKVIKLDNGGIYTNLNLVKITSGLPTTVKESYEFRDSDGNKIGTSIDIAKDSHIVSITYNETTQKLIYKYLDESGAEQTTEVDMGHLILETEVENGIQSVNGKLSIKLDTTGDDTGEGKFLTVGASGLKLNGVTNAIKTAIEALDAPDTAAEGQYVSSVSETDGKITVARLNVSDAVLNGYEKGTKPASTAIADTDSVKGAIAKLEHQIDAATTKVAKDAQASHLTLQSTTAADGSVTYTIGETDIASKTNLDAEIAARKAVDGQNGDTYTKNTSANYISGATSLNDADVKLDAALKARKGEIDALSAKTVTTVEATGATVDIDDADDGTKKITINVDGSTVSANTFSASSTTTEAPTANDSVSTVLTKLYAKTKRDAIVAGSATTVNATVNGTTVDVKLDTTSAKSTFNGNSISGDTGTNALTITSNGLFLSRDWDCGTF